MRVGRKITELSTWCLYWVLAIRQTLLYLLLFVGCLTADAQERPRVVRTSPENGAMSVDPATNELRVTFDQPMVTSGYSFVGGGPTFPEVVGRPLWISNTTIVLSVRLKPDHAYWLSINSDRYQGFRGTNGLPAVPYPISFRTAPSGTVDSLSQELNRESLRQLRSAVEDRYSHRDLRGVDWDARFDEFESRLIDAKTRAQFATLAGQLMEVARDIHIWLKVGDETFASFRRSVSPNVDLDLIKKTVPEYGSSGNPQPVSLSNGVTVFLPSWVAFTSDGDPFEGKGLSPDVHVAFSTDTTGEDPLINAALDFLLARPDFSGDGRVDFTDFLLFVQQFGLSQSDEGYDARYDLDNDGTIGFGDFLIFANAFGN